MSDLKAQLSEMMDQVEWGWLIPHVERHALVLVTPDLDLLEVGLAIANDNVTTVQRWISEQLIYKPSENQVESWNQTPDKFFLALIVQPYVLVQEPAIAAPTG